MKSHVINGGLRNGLKNGLIPVRLFGNAERLAVAADSLTGAVTPGKA